MDDEYTPAELEELALMNRPHSRMTQFRIGEISAVDSPAQEGATMAIMKRDHFTGDAEPADIMNRVDEIRLRHKCARTEAMRKFASLYPREVERSRSTHVASPAVSKRAPSPAAVAFQKRIDEIAARDRCPRHIAISKAQREHPHECRRAFAAQRVRRRRASKAAGPAPCRFGYGQSLS